MRDYTVVLKMRRKAKNLDAIRNVTEELRQRAEHWGFDVEEQAIRGLESKELDWRGR